ncbi:MSH2 family protein [Megaselia abdita]
MDKIGDNASQKRFHEFLNKLGPRPSNTFRFFERINETYSVHGKDQCDVIANIVFKSVAAVKVLGAFADEAKPKNSYYFLTLTRKQFEDAARQLLLVKNYRLEVYVMKNKNQSEWEIEYSGSPGNLIQFEDILFLNKEGFVGCGMLSIRFQRTGVENKMGIAFIDMNEYEFQVAEFVDDDFFAELESVLVCLAPKECLVPSLDGEYYSKINQILERNGILVTLLDKKDSSSKVWKSDLIQDLRHVLKFEKGQKEDPNSLPEIAMELSMNALYSGIKYMQITSDADNNERFKMTKLNFEKFIHLDSAAISAMNLLPKPGTSVHSPSYRWQSILGVLNHCRTQQGQRLMTQWVKQPLRDINTITVRHDIVQCLLEEPGVLKDLSEDTMKKFPDILVLIKKLVRKRFNLQDLFRIYQSILRGKKLFETLTSLNNATVKSVLCNSLESTLTDLGKLKSMVEEVIDFSGIDRHEYLIKDSYNETLLILNNKMRKILEKMDKLHDLAADDIGLEKGAVMKLDYTSQHGYHFRIPLKHDSMLRKSKNYQTISAIKGGVRFTNERLKELSEKFKLNRDEYKIQQNSIVDEIVKIAIGYHGLLSSYNNDIAQIDCLVAFAVAAQNAPIPYVRPKMSAEDVKPRNISLKGLRHPCIELQENVTFIANDANFKKDESHMYIITGPNMGGKSTYIKSVGIAVLMAHIGSFVPATEASISMVDSIMCRVGSSDSISKGLSTFMVEMIESASIIRSATENSLVIIDELGRGTSTYEGGGIAWSIAEHLAKNVRCFSLFATHFFETTNLAVTEPTVKNFHVAAIANEKNFTLLYEIRPKPMEQSFGIHVAKLVKFPQSVVQTADKVFNEFDEQNKIETEDDSKILKKIENSLDKMVMENLEVGDIQSILDEINKDIKKSDGHYKKMLSSKNV